jgi:hypothetical protein
MAWAIGTGALALGLALALLSRGSAWVAIIAAARGSLCCIDERRGAEAEKERRGERKALPNRRGHSHTVTLWSCKNRIFQVSLMWMGAQYSVLSA